MKVSNGWEFGCICISVDKDTPFSPFSEPEHLYGPRTNPVITSGEIQITVDEAEALAQQLLSVCQDFRQMDKECNEYFENQEKKNEPHQ